MSQDQVAANLKGMDDLDFTDGTTPTGTGCSPTTTPRMCTSTGRVKNRLAGSSNTSRLWRRTSIQLAERRPRSSPTRSVRVRGMDLRRRRVRGRRSHGNRGKVARRSHRRGVHLGVTHYPITNPGDDVGLHRAGYLSERPTNSSAFGLLRPSRPDFQPPTAGAIRQQHRGLHGHRRGGQELPVHQARLG